MKNLTRLFNSPAWSRHTPFCFLPARALEVAVTQPVCLVRGRWSGPYQARPPSTSKLVGSTRCDHSTDRPFRVPARWPQMGSSGYSALAGREPLASTATSHWHRNFLKFLSRRLSRAVERFPRPTLRGPPGSLPPRSVLVVGDHPGGSIVMPFTS